MAQVTLKDGNAANFAADVNANGRAAAAASAPVVLATEDSATLTAANTARGAIADAAYADATGAASGSLVALLKGIFVAAKAALPAGTNKIGTVGIADGDDAATGAKADAAYATANGSAAGSVVSLLKGLYVRLAGTLTVNPIVAATPVAPASTTIAAGGTAQTLFAANASRRGLEIQNQSTGDLYIGTAAALNQSSLKIPSGAYYAFPAGLVRQDALQIIGATTGQAFWAREW